MRGALIAVVLLAMVTTRAVAAVVVVGNYTEAEVTCTVTPQGTPAQTMKIKPGHSRAVTIGRNADLVVAGTTHKLDAYNAYVFVTEKGKLAVKGIEFPDVAPKLDDIPEAAPAKSDLLTIPVTLLVDDANPFAKAIWEPQLKKRFTNAIAVIKDACGVSFELSKLSEWKSDPAVQELSDLHSDLEEKMKPFPPGIVIGYTSRALPKVQPALTLLGPTMGPLKQVLLVRDGLPAGEWDRTEVLVQELGHYLGAVRVADTESAMRPSVGDGKASLAAFSIKFDPANTLIMNMWAEQIRTGKVKGWKDLTPIAKARFARIYNGMMQITPGEKFAQTYHDMVLFVKENPQVVAVAPTTPAAIPAKPMPMTVPMPNTTTLVKPATVVEAKLTPKEKAIRNVLITVTAYAEDAVAKGTKADELTTLLVKVAADAASTEDETVRVAAFAVGLGLALDDSTILRDNPLTRTMCKAVEPEVTRTARLKVIGAATVHGRRDLCQHFAVSLTLAEIVGPKLAEQAGVAKELSDMKGTSGFSFHDLLADFSGVELYNRLKADDQRLALLAKGFSIDTCIPNLDGLKEGFNTAAFEREFGSISDARYKAMVANIRERIKVTQDKVKK